jgi:hypothetical protein
MRNRKLYIALLAVGFAAISNVAGAQDPRPQPIPSGPIKKPGAVSRIDIVVRPKVFAGTCPGTVTWNAVIHVVNPPVQVEYTWERSDGATGPRETLEITSLFHPVSDTWQLGGSGDRLVIWEKLHVFTPNEMISVPPEAHVNCR